MLRERNKERRDGHTYIKSFNFVRLYHRIKKKKKIGSRYVIFRCCTNFHERVIQTTLNLRFLVENKYFLNRFLYGLKQKGCVDRLRDTSSHNKRPWKFLKNCSENWQNYCEQYGVWNSIIDTVTHNNAYVAINYLTLLISFLIYTCDFIYVPYLCINIHLNFL